MTTDELGDFIADTMFTPGGTAWAEGPYYRDDNVTLYAGDCLDMMKLLAPNTVEAVITDPPYSYSFMGRKWDSHESPLEFQLWCQQWATECLRVLKPGGHLLAFGGTRTSHRLACAIEDAGFEIRDSIAWLYGSGFPKSLDVSKAIDKVNGEAGRLHKFTAWMRTTGLTGRQLDEVTSSNMGGHYLTAASQPAIPTPALWALIRPLCGDVPAWVDELVERIEAERELIGGGKSGKTYGMGGLRGVETSTGEFDITAPATDAAKTWAGWGTALKPSWENVVCAVKPRALSGILDSIGSHLDRLESECKPTVNGAAKNSAPTQADSPAATTSTAHANAAIQLAAEKVRITATGAEADSSDQTATSAYESTGATLLNTVTSWKRCLAELCDVTSTFTTATNASLTTDLRTLNSCLSQITPENITAGLTNPSGSNCPVSAADNLFGAAVLLSRATRALSADATATSATPTNYPAGTGSHLEPIIVARKPIQGTVAANVLAWGTGALNIDACRVGTNDELARVRTRNAPIPGDERTLTGQGEMYAPGVRFESTANPAGRWPPNVILGGDTADMLDKESGTLTSGKISPHHKINQTSDIYSKYAPISGLESYGDSGGASRFFPTFKYTAKAGAAERPTADGINHPTVKPLSLISWMLKLVVPPHGTVLDPFAGTGTTGEAAILEHMHAILIEREPTYLPLIVKRLHKPIQQGFDFDQQDEGELF